MMKVITPEMMKYTERPVFSLWFGPIHPQFGQTIALPLISLPHSLQAISAMCFPFDFEVFNNYVWRNYRTLYLEILEKEKGASPTRARSQVLVYL
jgi:hypothetical protein